MPDDFRSKTLKMKQGDISDKTNCDMTEVPWKDQRDVQVLTNMHSSPAKGNFCDESGNALKPAIVEDYNQHKCYNDKSDRMVNSHYQSPYMEMDEKTVLSSPCPQNSNSHILLKSCGSKVSYRDFTD